MSTNEDIDQLRNKLDILLQKHHIFTNEIGVLIDYQNGFAKELSELLKAIDLLLIDQTKKEEVLKETVPNIETIKEEFPELISVPLSGVLDSKTTAKEDIKETEREVKFESEVIEKSNEVEFSKSESIIEYQEELVAEETTVEKPSFKNKFDYGVNSKTKNKFIIHNKEPKEKSTIERFIGENLIALIGIVILLIGVGIGVKYSIEHQLVSPRTRIIMGYFMGLGLLGVGIYLKKKYLYFSAVLVSGSIAIMYFVTYFGYSFYELMSMEVAFGLMFIFTTFAAITAIKYNLQLIAHIGLVGAYAVPILLSKGSGQIAILFGYMAIINIGILVLAFKKFWKPLYYLSFFLTWFVFISWFFKDYSVDRHFEIALIFLTIFYMIFYVIFLAYKIIRNEKYETSDILFLVGNSSLYYWLGINILNTHADGKDFLGLFTLINAILHFLVAIIFHKQKESDKNLFYLIICVVLVYLTIAVPIQFDGNWVTLLWTCESAALFWIGRTKYVALYEKISYILMILATISIIQDWQTVYSSYLPSNPESRVIPVFNIYFLTSMLFVGCFAFIFILFRSKKYVSLSGSINELYPLMNFLIPTILLGGLYFAGFLEIVSYWNQLYLDSTKDALSKIYYNVDLPNFKYIWCINYSMLFCSVISLINIKKIKSYNMGLVFIFLNIATIFIFLTQGLLISSELRETYLAQTLDQFYARGVMNIGIRYISYVFIIFSLISIYKVMLQDFMTLDNKNSRIGYDFILSKIILWIASSELIAIMDMLRSEQSYKLALSILWSVFALSLIAYGIWKRKKHLRIGAMVIFGVTILKIFVYDLAHLNTISKTIVLVVLGLILLISSFLYNKYKYLMVEKDEKKD